MKEVKLFHVSWEKYDWENIDLDQLNEGHHYGIYQIYGTHPIYGKDSLLYIGKAQDQTFGNRLKQHWDFDVNHFSEISYLHIGMIQKWDGYANHVNWGDVINDIERVLIVANCPAFNSIGIKGTVETKYIEHLLVINWGNYGRMLPEVSSLKYSSKYWDAKNYKVDHLTTDDE